MIKKIDHVFEKHSNCTKEYCNICYGGLCNCIVCGGAENSLTKECCGYKINSTVLNEITEGKVDYVGNKWRINV